MRPKNKRKVRIVKVLNKVEGPKPFRSTIIEHKKESSMGKIAEVLSQRTDISIYLAHLTKQTETGSAFENLVSILKGKKLIAYNHHCLFSPLLKNHTHQELFATVCFTETPLDKIQLLTNIDERKVNMEPYGLIFTKQTIRNAGGNPVFYLYEENQELKALIMKMFRENSNELEDFSHFGSLINVVKEKHDFSWEREWRIKGDYSFNYEDIFAIIAPGAEYLKIKKAVGTPEINNIFFIDPKSSMEQILERLIRCTHNIRKNNEQEKIV